MIFDLLPTETVLEEDYPIVATYVYICDGVFTRSPSDMTVSVWKARKNFKEIRRCNLFGHDGARLGDQVK